MALWSVTQTSSFDWKPTQIHPIGSIDDAVIAPAVRLLDWFGATERANVTVTQVSATEWTATIKYSPAVKAGFVRDREVPGDYMVTFRAVRVG